MPVDLQVPKRFSASPSLPSIRRDAPFLDAIRIPVSCDNPKDTVVPICIDTDGLKAGDVFLFHSHSVGSKVTKHYQSFFCGLPKRAANITHVALYAGAGMLWDHNPGENIRMRTVSSSLRPGTTFSVGRPMTNTVDKKRLQEICSHLQGQVNYQLLAHTNWRALRARANYARATPSVEDAVTRAMVCSTFVAQALDYASRSRFVLPVPIVLPGDFVNGSLFDALQLDWARIEE